MEEAVALDSAKQKKFVKSIKSLRKLIQQNKEGEREKPSVVTPKKDGKTQKRKRRSTRGLVYLSHIPHGFYEHQMTEYFKQFGVVTNVRVIRSRRTGNSKGCAFVEFKDPTVADIVSETMNNYLMGKRIIKAVCIPPEKQRKALRKNWTPAHNPTSKLRAKKKKEFNTDKDENEDLKKATKIVSNLRKLKRKLTELGINYSIIPVDVPEKLRESVKTLQQEVEDVKDNSEEKEVKEEAEVKNEKLPIKVKGIKKEKASTQEKEIKKDGKLKKPLKNKKVKQVKVIKQKK